MKNLAFLALVLGLMSFIIPPAKPSQKVATVTILTSSVCDDCKLRVEKELNYTKGVIYAELDVATKQVTIKYKTKLVSEQELKQVISNLGYDAGDLKRNEDAFNKLPKCCQSPGHCNHEEGEEHEH
jgi:mercuric ion binding protein